MTTEPTAPAPLPLRATPLSWRLGIAAGILFLGTFAFLARDTIGSRGQAGCGIVCFIGLAALCSANLRAVNPRTLLWGFVLQLSLALFVTQFDQGQQLFESIGAGIKQFLSFTEEGARFVFGELANPARMEAGLGQ